MKYDFSVIVLCYNPDRVKLKNTLYSILMQKDISMEILVADDGSKESYASELEEWFRQRDFTDYKLIMNVKNQGTVKNLLSALAVAEGRYTKNISPGDYLYDTDTLKAYQERMEQEQLSVCFGKAAYYSCKGQSITTYDRQSPIDLKAYRKKDMKRIRRNYLRFRDYALGACFAFELEAAKKYTEKIADHTRYCEDTAVICMVAAGEKLRLLDQFTVWYEYGTGISTAANAKWAKVVSDENKNVFGMLAEKDSLARKAYQYHFGVESSNKYWNTIRKIILYPPYLFFMIKALCGTRLDREYISCDKQKLEAILANAGDPRQVRKECESI